MKRPTDRCGDGAKGGCGLPRDQHVDQNPEAAGDSPWEHPFREPVRKYTMLYYAGPNETLPMRWDKTLEEFLRPQGGANPDPMLVFMLRELDMLRNGFMLIPTEDLADRNAADQPLEETLDERLESAGFDESDRMYILETIMPALTTPALDFPL